MRYLIDPTPLKDGSNRNPLRLKVCEIYVQSRIRNHRVVQKLQCGVKVTDIHDGFRLARLTWLNLLTFLPGTFSDVCACV